MAERGKENKGFFSSGKFRQGLAAFSATLLALSAGTALAWTGPTLLLFKTGTEPVLNDEQASWVGSLITIGAFVGCLPAGVLGDSLGRKTLLLYLAGPLLCSWCLLLFSKSVWGLYLGRLMGGFTIGVMSAAAPAYIADIAEPKVRGTLGALFQMQIVLGVLLMFILGVLNNVFQITLICTIIPNIFILFFVWMPESPVFLVMKGKTEEAAKALRWLRGGRDPQDELAAIQARLEDDTSGKAGILDVFYTAVSRKAIFLSLGLMLVQQASGVNALSFYAYEIYLQSRVSLRPEICGVISSVVTVSSTVVAVVLIDRLGRRTLLLVSALLMGLSLAGVGCYLWIVPGGESWLPIFGYGLYFLAFSLGFGPIPWVMMAELFLPRLAASASAITAAASWGLGFLVTKFHHDLDAALGLSLTLWFYASWCFLGTVWVAFCVPETKGKTPQEIVLQLAKKNSSQPVIV